MRNRDRVPTRSEHYLVTAWTCPGDSRKVSDDEIRALDDLTGGALYISQVKLLIDK